MLTVQASGMLTHMALCWESPTGFLPLLSVEGGVSGDDGQPGGGRGGIWQITRCHILNGGGAALHCKEVSFDTVLGLF